MQIQTAAQVIINADIEAVFDASTNCQNLPKFFTGYKAIPAILSAKTMDESPLCEGSTRIVNNNDGSWVKEIIVALKRPHLQKYELIEGLKPPFSWLVRSASGEWLYEEVNSKTKVDWIFEFEVTNILTYWIFNLVVKESFQKAQEICLNNLKGYLEDNCIED